MKKIEVECQYCGHKEIINPLTTFGDDYDFQDYGICVKCQSFECKVRDLRRIDFYQGSPPFKKAG